MSVLPAEMCALIINHNPAPNGSCARPIAKMCTDPAESVVGYPAAIWYVVANNDGNYYN